MTLQHSGQPWRLMNWNTGEGQFAVDMFETEDEVVVRAAIGGAGSEVQLTASGDMLRIQASTSSQREESGPTFRREQRTYSSFSRTINLPAKVDAERADAAIVRGVLVVRLPKLARGESKTVDVRLREEA